jgi:hypothetical protein
VVRDWLLTHGGDAPRRPISALRSVDPVDPHRGRICPSRRESSWQAALPADLRYYLEIDTGTH